jgi:hypothetical protein
MRVVKLESDVPHALPNRYRQADRELLTPEDYRLLASRLTPEVAPLIDLPPG